MNKTIKEAVLFVDQLVGKSFPSQVEAVICAPFLSLPTLKDKLEGSQVKLGAQNAHWADQGAYTGEISIPMLKDLGIEYVILGHSERRMYFAETCETVNKKTVAALRSGLIPIVCVGETLEEREAGSTAKVVSSQVSKALQDLDAEEVKKVILAYEPIWAIGTGRASSADDAEEVIAGIRQTVEKQFGSAVANEVRIQYGGSVKPDNIAKYMAKPNIDGALVGGAALDPQSFYELVTATSKEGAEA
jgi:triosephosphate isomerase